MRTVRSRVGAAGAAVMLAVTGCSHSSGDSYEAGVAMPEQVPPPGSVFQDYGVNPYVDSSEDNRSTFALDVDTGSYTIARGWLRDGSLPQPASVRTEEFVNYYPQDYPVPDTGMSVHVDGTDVPFLPEPATRVLRVGLQAAAVDAAEREPVNLTFVVDTSGSMRGWKMEMVTSAMHRLLDTLRPDDAVAVVSFDDRAQLLLPMTSMDQVSQIRAGVDALTPGGSTNLEEGLRIGYEHARSHLRPDGLNRVVVLSDGVANQGLTDPGQLAAQIAQESGDHTQLVVIGVGRETYDEVVLEQFANQGNGFYAYLDGMREAERLFVHELTGTLRTVALDAKVQVSFDPETVTRFRLLGFENRQLDHDDLRDDSVDGGEVGAGHNVTALYEVSVPDLAQLSADAELATVVLVWRDPDTGESMQASAVVTAGDVADSFEAAPPRLRQDILVAALAEHLRGAAWAELVDLPQLADQATTLHHLVEQDEHLAELVELVQLAAELST